MGDFVGERFSIVYFTCSCHALADKGCKENLTKLGFNYPTADSDPYSLLRPPRGYPSRGQKRSAEKEKKGELPSVRVMPVAQRDTMIVSAKGLKTMTPIKLTEKERKTPALWGAR